MAVIRLEQPADVDSIRAVHDACFPTRAEGRLVDLLRKSAKLNASCVAEVDGQIVGHIGVSPVSTGSHHGGLGLAPLAVLEAHRRQGFGAQLIEYGLVRCRAAGVGWVVVLGSPDYYGRFGFRFAAEFGLNDEYGGGPAFQLLELTPGAAPAGAGLVRYADEFASLDAPL